MFLILYYVSVGILLRFTLGPIYIGVFAIAFAVDILNGFSEIGKRFDVAKMRLCLLKCLEEEEFTLFPRSHKHTKLSKGHIIYVDIYCICRSPFYNEDSERDENLFMAECVKCGEWYHKRCLEIPSRVFTNESFEWKCTRC